MKTTSHATVEHMVFAAYLAVVAGTSLAADWPCFRGPNRDGISPEVIAKLPPTEAWRTTVGSGYSQVVVSGGRVYTVGDGIVYCFDETSGSGVPLWTSSAIGGYSTPAVDGTNLYVLSPNGNLSCLDTATGTTRWSASLKRGTSYNATSPLIEGNLVILNIGSRGTAVNKNTGAVVWGNDAKTGIEASPIVFTRSNQRTILAIGKYGVDPATGNIMWALPAAGWCADVILHSDRVWTGMGVDMSVTSLDGGTVWSGTNGTSYGCHVLYDGHLYGATGNGFKCIEFATGVEKWGVPFTWLDSWATVILAKDQLIVLSPEEDGGGMGLATSRLVVINATPAGYQEIYRMDGVVSGLTCPTLANGRLYLRNYAGTLVCYDVSGGTNWNGVQVYPSRVTVAEGSSATFAARLAKKPASAATVTTARTGGDTDLTVQSGAAIAFTPDNWSEWQTVTLAAAVDADTADGSATFTCTAPGLDAATVTATEMDSDTSLTTLTVLSGGNGATLPNGATSVTRNAATTIVAAPEAAYYKFSNWTVTSGEAVFGDFMRTSPTTTVTIAAPATIQANFQYNGTTLTVQNDGHGTTEPSGATLVGIGVPVSISAKPNPGYAFLKWTTGSSVGFGNASSASTTVTTVYGGNIQATFTSCEQAIVASIRTDTQYMVREGETFTFYVKLMAPPASNVTVTVERTFGDADIAVAAGSNLTFSSENWGVCQPVTLSVAEDNDAEEGRASFTCSAPGWTSTTVMVVEWENDSPEQHVIVASAGGTTTPNGTNIVINDAAARIPVAISATANPGYVFLNWWVKYSDYYAKIADPYAASTTVSFLSGAYVQADFTNATQALFATAGVKSPMAVNEGGTNSFQIRLLTPPATNVNVTVARVSGDLDIAAIVGTNLTFTPANWDAFQTVTLAAAEDNDIVCGTACFACSAAGWIGATVTVSEVDNDTNATLVVNASAGGVTTPRGTNTVLIASTFEINQQTPISIVATPDPGYAFVNWITSAPGCTARIADANTANTTVRVVAYGATVQANFEVIADPHGDDDGDGMDNLAESIAGTDPRDNRSLLEITGFRFVPEGVIIDWKGGQAARQRLEVCADLVTPATGWTPVYSNVNLPTPVTNSFIHAGCANSNRFYRIRAER